MSLHLTFTPTFSCTVWANARSFRNLPSLTCLLTLPIITSQTPAQIRLSDFPIHPSAFPAIPVHRRRPLFLLFTFFGGHIPVSSHSMQHSASSSSPASKLSPIEIARQQKAAKAAHKLTVRTSRQSNAIISTKKRELNRRIAEFEKQLPELQLPPSSDAPKQVGRPPYPQKIIDLSSSLYQASPKAYNLLRENGADVLSSSLPSPKTIQRHLREDIEAQMELLTDQKQCHKIMQQWRKDHELPSRKKIPVILSVDAINFRPYLTLDDRGVITGINKAKLEEDLSGTELYWHLSRDLDGWQDWVDRHWRDVLTAAFVYYVQPLSDEYSCVVLHWHEKENGKAGPDELSLWLALRRRLQKCHFRVVALASDADSGYERLHNLYQKAYLYKNGRKMRKVDENLRVILMISDPLHLLKRLRYRLLQGRTFTSGFSLDAPTWDSSKLQEMSSQLRLPAAVFDNSDATKMHDTLPLALFTPEVLRGSLRINSILAAYILPGVILNTALRARDLSRNERLELLKLGYGYMKEYWQHSSKKLPKGLTSTKLDKTSILFDTKLARHFMNTFRTLAYILATLKDTVVSLNRCGSNPLEHYFGKLRIGCCFYHTLNNCLRVLCTDQVIRDGPRRITGRVGSYGEVVPVEDEQDSEADHFFVDSAESIAPMLYDALNLAHRIEPSKRVVQIFDMVLTAVAHDPRFNTAPRNGLSLELLTLKVTSGLKGRHLTESKSETARFIGLRKKETRRIELESVEENSANGLREAISELKLAELKEIIAEVSANTGTVIRKLIRKRDDAIDWLHAHWDVAETVIGLWFARQEELAQSVDGFLALHGRRGMRNVPSLDNH